MNNVIPPSDTRRREKVGALYSTVPGLLAIISRVYPLIPLSCAMKYNYSYGSSVVVWF